MAQPLRPSATPSGRPHQRTGDADSAACAGSGLLHRPFLVVMGVSGCGKSRVGAAIAAYFGISAFTGIVKGAADRIGGILGQKTKGGFLDHRAGADDRGHRHRHHALG